LIKSVQKLFAGRRIVLPATIYAQAITLIRNVIVARLLGPEQFGLAVSFLLAQQFIDMATDTGLNKFILQNKFGNRPSVQATVHAVAATRGLLVAALIIGVAYPLFGILNLSTQILPFLLLAMASFSTGLLHYDNARQQRNAVFVNDSLSSAIGDTAGLLTSLIALQFTHSYIVVLYGIMARAIAVCATSHLLARRRYILRFSAVAAASLFAFSWPLLINGPLLFLSSQADRIFVNAMLGLHELGIYSATLLLVMLPLGLLTRVLGAVALPGLAAGYHAGTLETGETHFIGVMLMAFLIATCGFAAIGPALLRLLYGNAYAQAALPVALIGLTQGMRFLRTWPSTLALSIGRTGNLLLSNIIRLIALPLGFAGILLGDGIIGLVIGLLLGEVIALILSLMLLNRARALPLGHSLPIVAIACAVAVCLPLAIWIVQPGYAGATGIALATAFGAVFVIWRVNPRLVPRDLSLFGW
jgi:lipopolysaccharide exporter